MIILQKTLSEVERDMKNSAPALKPQTKGKRMAIQEVENSDEEGGKDSAGSRVAGSAGESKTSSLSRLCRRLPMSRMSSPKGSICTEIVALEAFSSFVL